MRMNNKLLMALLVNAIVASNSTTAFAYFIIVDDETPLPMIASVSIKAPVESAVNLKQPIEKIEVRNPLPPKIPSNTPTKKYLVRHLVAKCPVDKSCGKGDMHPVNYSIHFDKNKSIVNTEAGQQIDVLIPRMQNTKICILGRPDAVTYQNSNVSKLSNARAYNIRAYLISKGVPPNSIAIAAGTTPNPETNGNGYFSDVIINEKMDTQKGSKDNLLQNPKTSASLITPESDVLLGQAITNHSTKVSLVNNTAQTVTFINTSMAAGKIEAATGHQLINMIKATEANTIKNLTAYKNL